MFGLGFQELVVIAVIALVLLGPKRLPDLMKTLGKLVRDFQSATDDIKRELNRPVEEDAPPKSIPALNPTQNEPAASGPAAGDARSEDNALPIPGAEPEKPAAPDEPPKAGETDPAPGPSAAPGNPAGIPPDRLAG